MPVRRPLTWRATATVVAILGSGLFVVSCGGGSPSPSTPPVVAPTPTPAPPVGGGGATASSCPLGKGSASAVCDRESTLLLQEVEGAIDRVIDAHPELFDLTREALPGTRAYYVLDKESYLEAVIGELHSAGLCAEQDYDGGETISVKDSTHFSEDFDLILSDGFVRRGSGAYRQTCSPASFPIDPGADWPPPGSGCGKPYPPPVSRFNVKVHLTSADVKTIDSTPLVGPDPAYCAAIGFTDGRAVCAVRPEGAPDREACEAWRVGVAKDTGRVGPTWTYEGEPCTGLETGCENHPGNQFQVLGHRSGHYQACAESGACGSAQIP